MGAPLSYAIEAEKIDYYDLCFGIKKWNNEEAIPFKGNWQNTGQIPLSWKETISSIFRNLAGGWKVSDWYIAWKYFDSHYRNMDSWQKKFYLEIIKKGYDTAAEYYFKELLRLKEATEELIDEFIELYKK